METKDEEKKLIYNLEDSLYGKEYGHILNELKSIALRMTMGGNEGIHSFIKK